MKKIALSGLVCLFVFSVFNANGFEFESVPVGIEDLVQQEPEDPSARDKIGKIQRALTAFYAKEGVYRVTFALTRFTLNSVSLAWTLSAIPQATPSQTLPVAIAMGLFSGTSQYFNQKVVAFVTKPKTKVGRALRWLGLDSFFYGLGKTVGFVTGLQTGSPGEILMSALRGAFTGAATQMPLDLAVGAQTRLALDSATDQTRARVRFISDLKTLAVSAGTTAATLAALELPNGQIFQVVVMVLGVGEYIRTLGCEKALKRG